MYASKEFHSRENSKSGRGFIALISVLILSLVFLVAVVSVGQFGLSGRLLLLDLESKVESETFAEACVQSARILIAIDPLVERSNISITPKEDGDVSCTLVSLEADTPSAGESRILSQSMVDGATTNFEVIVDSSSLSVNSWEECPVMGEDPCD